MATQVSDTGSKTRARGAADELAVIAQRAQAFTNASGTAIALSEGNADEIICRARSGSSAPDVGTALRVEGSFTGLCIQSGKELRCDDAETDTRVDTGAIRALGIRSMVVTPIKDDNRVVGVLAVFAPTAHAFTITHVAVLKTMADQISILLQKERKAREEGVQPEPARPPAPVSVPKPVASAPIQPPPVVIKPAASPSQRASFPVVSKVEPIKASPVAEEIALPAALPKKEEKRGENRHEARASLSSFEAAAGEGKKFPKNMVILGVAALAIGGASFYAYRSMHKTASPAPTAHAPETPSTVVPPPASGAGNSVQPSTPAAIPANTAAPANVAPKPVELSAADRRNSDRSAAKNVPPPAAAAPAPAPVSAPPEKRTPAAVAVSSGTSKIASSESAPASSDAAPVLNVAAGSVPTALTSLTKPVASSTPSMISQSDLEPVQVTKRVAPLYPPIAKARRLSGTVTVQFVVSKEGKATNLQFVSGLPVFRDAAFDAVKQWQFKPAKLNGQIIEQTQQVEMKFTPQ
ncbi:MAG TPA: TonB family protein [Candidatus Angelobacter sp.]|nr:TonB family protein [Candidatus Angelobacter sp.]